MVLDFFIAFFLILGGGFILIGSIGLVRLNDLFMRLHGPTKATTLGIGGILIGSMLHFGGRGEGLSLHELLISLFIFTTAPISAYLVGRAGLHLQRAAGQSAAQPPLRGDEQTDTGQEDTRVAGDPRGK